MLKQEYIEDLREYILHQQKDGDKLSNLNHSNENLKSNETETETETENENENENEKQLFRNLIISSYIFYYIIQFLILNYSFY